MGNVYEYDNGNTLKGLMSKYFVVPQSVVLDKDLDSKAILLFCYFSATVGIDYSIYDDISHIILSCGGKPDLHSDGNNQKFVNSFKQLVDKGYISYNNTSDISYRLPFKAIFNTDKIQEDCSSGSFAIIYLDEFQDIIKSKYTRKENILSMFIYLRSCIYNRPNIFRIEEIHASGGNHQDDIALRIKNMPEAFNSNYKNISKQIGFSEKATSKYCNILDELNLIKCFNPYVVTFESSRKITPDSIFVNTTKRNKNILYAKDKEYYLKEVMAKEKIMKRYYEYYCIKY